jgi:GT2 family glycosyltransferase
VAGANSLPVNVIVLEQSRRSKYRHARTVHMTERFNYNRFANCGAQMGDAEWIMIANNDLIFHDGWLHHLLAADNPVVSPREPKDYRQVDIEENISGYQTGRHLSGWCFMIKRELWRAIGGFDDCVEFWFSDDVVIEQVKAKGYLPMLVHDSVVEHLGSVTLKQSPNHDDLTWGQVEIFNEKYGKEKFHDDPRYRAWKAAHATQ